MIPDIMEPNWYSQGHNIFKAELAEVIPNFFSSAKSSVTH